MQGGIKKTDNDDDLDHHFSKMPVSQSFKSAGVRMTMRIFPGMHFQLHRRMSKNFPGPIHDLAAIYSPP